MRWSGQGGTCDWSCIWDLDGCRLLHAHRPRSGRIPIAPDLEVCSMSIAPDLDVWSLLHRPRSGWDSNPPAHPHVRWPELTPRSPSSSWTWPHQSVWCSKLLGTRSRSTSGKTTRSRPRGRSWTRQSPSGALTTSSSWGRRVKGRQAGVWEGQTGLP